MQKQEQIINWIPQQWAKPDALSRRERVRLQGRALNRMVQEIHRESAKVGNWREPEKGDLGPPTVELVLLQCVSDLALAAQSHVSPQAVETSLAACLVRICDVAGELGLDLGGAVAERLQ